MRKKEDSRKQAGYHGEPTKEIQEEISGNIGKTGTVPWGAEDVCRICNCGICHNICPIICDCKCPCFCINICQCDTVATSREIEGLAREVRELKASFGDLEQVVKSLKSEMKTKDAKHEEDKV